MKKTKYFIIACFVIFYFISSCGVVFGQPISFDALDRSVIAAHDGILSTDSIPINYDTLLFYKTAIFKTNEGRYGKFRIIDLEPISGSIDALVIEWVTYNADGSIASSGGDEWPYDDLIVYPSDYCDFDTGVDYYDFNADCDLKYADFYNDFTVYTQNGSSFALYNGNNPPNADAGSNQTVTDSDNNDSEDVALNGSGSTDADGTIASYVWSEGSQIATGATPTVNLSAGIHTITLTVTDDIGAIATDTVTVKVNKLPIADVGSNQTVTDSDNNDSQSVTLNGSSSTDSDGTITSYVWSESGSDIATGVNPTVSLNAGIHTITLTVTDSDGATDTDTVTVTVESPPTADAGSNQTVNDSDDDDSEDVTLNGSGSTDLGGSITSYVWSESGSDIATGVSPTITLSAGTYTITLTVTDNDGDTDTDTVIIKVNKLPIADAGSNQTVTDSDNNDSQSVTLNGSGSTDSDGTIASYVWSEGSQIATGETPTVSLSAGTHTITLTVTDSDGAIATDTVTVTVESPPTADAGSNQTVTDSDDDDSEDVTLNGSGSTDLGGSITSYVWSEGGQIATGATPAVTLSAGTHTITLTVTDNDGDTDTDTVTIKVNKLPNANAGTDQIVTDSDDDDSEDVTLNGLNSSDSDGTITSYIWSESGSDIATGPNPTVTLSAGTHTITLTVSDSDWALDTDTVTVKVNKLPIADAGSNQTVTDSDNNDSEDVALNGSGSTDSDGTIASYVWSESGSDIATGVNPTVSLSAGIHTITLTVTDSDEVTDTDTVTVTVESPPTADAGDDQILPDTNSDGSEDVILDGSGSTDLGGTITSYVWSEGVTDIATGMNPTVTLSAGIHAITLTVTDNDGDTDTDTVTITVNTPPDKPTNTLCDGKTSPADNVSDYTPLFSWSFSDDDAGDSQLAYQIIVGTSAGLSDIWDSGKVYSGVESASYTGSTNLLPNTTSLAIPYQYHWSVKVWDSNEGESVYSDDSTFVILDIGLRMFDGTGNVKIAVDYVDSTYELRVRKDGVTYGIILVDITDPDASNIRIKTTNGGIKALKKM